MDGWDEFSFDIPMPDGATCESKEGEEESINICVMNIWDENVTRAAASARRESLSARRPA